MSYTNISECDTPFKDITTTICTDNVDGTLTSNARQNPIDPAEWRRQRDRERYAQMSQEKKNELLRKCRETRQRDNAPIIHLQKRHESVTLLTSHEAGCLMTSQEGITNVCSPIASNFVPPPLSPRERKRQRERDRYAAMSPNKKNELLKRNREARQQKNVVPIIVNQDGDSELVHVAQPISDGDDTTNKENIEPIENTNWLHRNDMYNVKRKCDREDNNNMTLHQKKAKSQRKKELRAFKRNAMSQDSIAMENPLYIPEVIPLEVQASGTPASIMTRDWPSLEVAGTPYLGYKEDASDQVEDLSSPELDVIRRTHRKHITPGERHELLARQNKKFEEIRRKNVHQSTEEESMQLTNGLESTVHPSMEENLSKPMQFIKGIVEDLFKFQVSTPSRYIQLRTIWKTSFSTVCS